jgi:hypothetical protein
MADYHVFTSARSTVPDPAQLLVQLRALDPTAGMDGVRVPITVKKATTWTATQITAAQNVIDTAPAMTPQSVAQAEIDAWPIMFRSLVLALVDEINILRSHPAIGLTARTPAQAIAAIRNKAATL